MRLAIDLIGWNRMAISLGGLAWVFVALARLSGWVALSDLDLLLLLALCVIMPLAIPLVTRSTEDSLSRQLSRLVILAQPFAALCGGVSFMLERGALAAVLAGVWLLFTGIVALMGVAILLRQDGISIADTCLAAALVYVPVGGAWFVLARWGLRPLGFSETTVVLTAVHFHFISLAGLITTGLVGQAIQATPGSGSAPIAYRVAAIGMLVNPLLVAMGITLTRVSAIVNLAGASPAHWRWTKTYRARIRESRLHAGEAVMQAILRYGPPEVLVQASAAGYYGNRGQEILTETSTPGTGFRAEVCQEWEKSTARMTVRRCVLRTGIVLDAHAGALPSLLLFARLCGRRLGDGQQWIPWMHKWDVARAIQFLIEDRTQSGPFNLCAPEPTTNREFLRVARQALKRLPVFPLPAFVLQALLGEMSSVVLDSERVLPRRLLDAGFPFEYPRLDAALYHLLREP